MTLLNSEEADQSLTFLGRFSSSAASQLLLFEVLAVGLSFFACRLRAWTLNQTIWVESWFCCLPAG